MNAERFLVLTGAGISAESGVPTFRGAGSYWRNLDPMTLASPQGFAANPALVWEWYRERRAGIRAAQPNAAHVAVTRLALEAPECLVVTQNVDDLHRRATHEGATVPDDRIVQIHGDIFIDRCERCDKWGRGSFKEDSHAYVAASGHAVEPLNVAGLCDPSKANWNGVDLQDMIRGAARLGVSEAAVREMLERSGCWSA